MSIRRCLALLALGTLCLAPSCRGGPPEGARADRVVMVSYDGLGADLAWSWIDGGVAESPEGLAGLAERGFAASRLRMANPTLTSVNHITLVTGAPASGTGIVSNSFHLPGTPLTETESGYSSSSEVPALWAAAVKRGIRVGTLLWPGADAQALDRMGDFGVVWPRPPLASSEILELDPADAATTGELPSEDGVAPLLWRLEVELPGADPAAIAFEVVSFDGNPDGRARFDTVAARRSQGEIWQMVGEREWFEIELEARASGDLRPHRYGFWSKPLRLDRFGGGMRFYRGAAGRLVAYPKDFEDRLTDAVGPWPGEPDERALEAWWLDMEVGIDLDTYLEQIERLDRYLDHIARWVIANEDFRLLLAYHPTADEFQHTNLIVHPDQWAYTPGVAVAAREGLKRLGRSIDRSIAEVWRSLSGSEDALVVVSDHGVVPLHDEVQVNRVLEEAGLVEVLRDDGRARIAPDSPMMAVAHGACAHVYLNLVGREQNGAVRRAEAGELLARAARALADVAIDGRHAVERIFTRQEAADIGLDHPNSGDLIVFLEPGFTGSSRLQGEPIEPSRYYGQHGYLAEHEAMDGVFFARGAGIRRGRTDEMRATEVAPLVARWLGFELR